MIIGLDKKGIHEVLSTLLDPVFLLSSKSIVIHMNSAAEEITGFKEKAAIGQHIMELGYEKDELPKSVKKAKRRFNAAVKEGGFSHEEYEIPSKSGKKIPVVIAASVLKDEKDRIQHVIVVLRSNAEQKQNEQLLRVMTSLGSRKEMKEGLDLILKTSFTVEGIDCGGIYIVDMETGALRLINDDGLSDEFVQQIAFLDVTTPQAKMIQLGNPIYANFDEVPGVDEIQKREGLKSIAIIPIKHEDQVIAVLNLASHTHPEIPLTSREFIETLAVQVGGVIDRWNLEERIEKRTSELRETQEQLVRSERLAVLGRLSGGIGHELRNPLGAIKTGVFFLRMALEHPDQDVSETLDILEKEISTSERIIKSLLDFARLKPPVRQKAQVNDIISAEISRIHKPDEIELITQLEPELPSILADPIQIGQIVMNIFLNAVQAMPDGGHLTITTRLVDSKWIAMAFTDTGVGIPEEHLHTLYEPLFTTKAKGIGLGLAITKMLVDAHDGSIEVQSDVGKGTTFTVKLPIFNQET